MKDATLRQAIKLLTLADQGEIGCEELQKFFASGLFTELLKADIDAVDRDIFRKLMNGVRPANIYPLWIDFQQDIHELIKDGKYDRINILLGNKGVDFFPKKKGYKKILFELIYVSVRNLQSAIRKIESLGYRLVNFHELVAFGNNYSQVQQEIGWANSYDSGCLISISPPIRPTLQESISGRELNILESDAMERKQEIKDTCFVVVRKEN